MRCFDKVVKSQTSIDALSSTDYDSSEGSTISSVWESSEPDISVSEAEDEATDYSGSCSAIEPPDHYIDEDKDLTENINSQKQQPSPALTSGYNLRSGSKRKSSTTDGPPTKKPCPPTMFQNGGRQSRGVRGRNGHDHGGSGSHGHHGLGPGCRRYNSNDSSSGKGHSKQGDAIQQDSIQNVDSCQRVSSLSKQKG